MTGRAALAAIALSAPAAADVPGRLQASVAAGGGWASDVYLGAGAGDNGFAQVAPAARLDLSLAPAWKLAALGEAFYGTYQPSGYSALSERGMLEARWLPDDPWELSLLASLDHVDFSPGEPLDPGLVASPTVTASTGWRVGPAARLRAAGWEWRASAAFAWRRSPAEGQALRERLTSVLLGASRPLGRRFDLSFTGRLTRSDSQRQNVAHGAVALQAGAGARILEETRLEAVVLLQAVRFDTDVRERLGRLTLALTHPLCERVNLEASWSIAGNRSSDPARAAAWRQAVFLGLTGRAGSLEW